MSIQYWYLEQARKRMEASSKRGLPEVGRRGFLGSVIGTLVASKVPFIAEPCGPVDLKTGLDSTATDYVLRLMLMTEEEIRRSARGSIVAGFSGEPVHQIWAPKISRIVGRGCDLAAGAAYIDMRFDDFDATQSIRSEGAGLSWADCTPIRAAARFSGGSQCLNPGDRLKVTYRIVADGLSGRDANRVLKHFKSTRFGGEHT